MNKKCCIFAAGDFNGKGFDKGEYSLIIAADAGYHHLEKMNITPDILLGDFDTIGEIPSHKCVIPYPPEKDYTDSELAIMEGIKRGYDNFTIFGAIGGKRLEHTIANISLAAAYSKKSCDITLSDGTTFVKAITNSRIIFDENSRGFVSVFSFGGNAVGVCESGLKYTLHDMTLDSSNPTLCVSNEFIGQKAEISVADGTIIIIWQKTDN